MSYLRDVLTTLAATQPAAGAGPAIDDLDSLERHLRELRRDLAALEEAVDASHDRAEIRRRWRALRKSPTG